MAFGSEIERLIVRLMGDGSAYLSMLARAETRTMTFARNVEQMGRLIGASLSAPAAGIGIAATRAFGQFDLAMTRSTSIITATDQQVEALAQTARETSRELAFTPTQLADTYYELASAGFNVETQQRALGIVSRFAMAGSMDLANATRLLTQATAALGLRTGETEQDLANLARVSNTLSEAANTVEGTIQEMAEAVVNDAGAMSRMYNVAMEDLVAGIMAFHRVGTRGADAGGQLGRAIRLMANSANDARRGQEALVFSAMDGIGNFRRYGDVMNNVRDIFRGASTEARAYGLEMIGMQALQQRAILQTADMGDQINNWADGLRALGNVTDTISKKQMKAFFNRLQLIKNEIDIVAISIGKHLEPTLMALGDAITGVLKWWQQLNSSTQRLITTIGLFTIAVGPVLIVLGLIGPIIYRVGAAIYYLVTGAAGLVIGLGQLTASIGLLSGALLGLSTLGVGLVLKVFGAPDAISNAVIQAGLMVAVVGALTRGLTLLVPLLWANAKALIAGAAAFLGWSMGAMKGITAAAALKGALTLAAVAITGVLVVALVMANQAQERLNASMREGEALQNRVLAMQRRRGDVAFAEATAIEDPAERLEALRGTLEQARRTREAQERNLTAARNAMERASTATTSVGPVSYDRQTPFLGFGLEAQYQQQRRVYTDLQGQVAATSEEMTRLEQAMAPLLPTNIATRTSSQAAAAAIRSLGQAATTMGVDMMKATERAIKLREDIKEFTEKMRTEIATFGKTNEEVKLYELELRGASEAQLEEARALIETKKELDAMNDSVQHGTDLLNGYQSAVYGSAEALRRIEAQRESFRTPLLDPRITAARNAAFAASAVERSTTQAAMQRLSPEGTNPARTNPVTQAQGQSMIQLLQRIADNWGGANGGYTAAQIVVSAFNLN